ncbi:hypothetical protein OsccyDRAFT_0132 [Leptolyngbyaceae cyanobacterium JSC-12]|nr:hypothetical protein OsccyDRAFT_0132 [Leptolyngbyaceae cyanobacterium JSC-12]
MARRYTRREFITDASFALGSSLLLKLLAPGDRAIVPITLSSSMPVTHLLRPSKH